MLSKSYKSEMKKITKVIKAIYSVNYFTHTVDLARIDSKRRYVYIIAALVKSLADVPEQVNYYLNCHVYRVIY